MLGGEMMIMSAVDSTFFTLDEIATLIWQSADGKTPLTEIARKLSEEYDVAPSEAERDAAEFVQDLSQHGILIVSDSPLPQGGPAQAQP